MPSILLFVLFVVVEGINKFIHFCIDQCVLPEACEGVLGEGAVDGDVPVCGVLVEVEVVQDLVLNAVGARVDDHVGGVDGTVSVAVADQLGFPVLLHPVAAHAGHVFLLTLLLLLPSVLLLLILVLLHLHVTE